MTKIIFDIKRDNGYGKDVYLAGTLSILPNQRADALKPTMSLKLGNGPVEFDLEPTNGEMFWTVREIVGTSGGSQLRYERNLEIPDSSKPVNYLDLPDVDPNSFFTEKA
jgi:hypothetical protein